MKNISQFILLVLLSCNYSCYEDLGNYIYDDPEQIKVTGIEPLYEGLTGVDSIIIRPDLILSDSNATFEYNWYVFELNGVDPINDTICRKKNMEMVFNLEAGVYELIYSVKNLDTGYTKYTRSKINTYTEFSRGWYVSTDDGVNSDIHLFYTDDNKAFMPTGKSALNLLTNLNGQPTIGRNGVFLFLDRFKTYQDDGFYNTRVLLHYTEDNVSIIDLESFDVIKKFNDVFFSPPSEEHISSFVFASNGLFLNTGDALYNIDQMISNSGQFGESAWLDDQATPYELSRWSINDGYNLPTYFDNKTKSFLIAYKGNRNMRVPTDGEETEMSCANTGKNLKYMMVRKSYPQNAVAIMEDEDNVSNKYLAKINTSWPGPFMIDMDTLSLDDKIYSASVYGQNYYVGGDILYFSDGSEVWSRNLANNVETYQFTVPSGEEVVYISHKYGWRIGLNHIVVASQLDNNTFKVRLYRKKAGGKLEQIPDFEISGKGTFSDIIYIEPKIDSSDYAYLSRWSK